MTKEELGDKLGVTGAYISLVETGRAKPLQFKLIRKAAELLKLTRKEELEIFKLAFEERLKANDKELFEHIEKLTNDKS
jgi:transcriptional regulator with XRE-family HTH domain